MLSASSCAKGLATAGLLTGLWLGLANVNQAQDSVLPAPVRVLPVSVETAQPAPAIPLPAEPASPPAAAAEGTPTEAGSSADAPKPPPSPWAKVPPVATFPRLGWFLIPPTGPGYYSLRDVVEGNCREAPPKYPYPPTSAMAFSFFDADFRYLEDPDNKQHDCFDPLKRIHLGCDWLLSFGGEERIRYENEVDSRLTGKDNVYELNRIRLYADLWYRDLFRVYVEFIDARTYNQDLPPLPIDQNKTDLLNLFADLKIGELHDKPIYVRVGRQELLYGSERLISPLDWANTRRTFQGVKGFWHGDKVDVDLFWVQPVTISPSHFDSPDSGRGFAGFWTTYRPQKGHSIDLYYLNLDQTRPIVARSGSADVGRGGQDISTLGSRYAGDYQQKILWDFEGMYQFGDFASQPISAGAYSVGLGYHFDMPMDPQFWIYNEYASGDRNPGAGHYRGTFNQLFPFGHYYFGFLDQVGRQNIDDLNMQFALYPAKWIQTVVQYHMFRLDSAKDALYNAAGNAIRRDPTGRAGTDVGEEIDLLTNFHLTTHQDILVGYSRLSAGDFIKRTGNPGSPDLFYLQYSFKW
jgi:hypothetical protein